MQLELNIIYFKSLKFYFKVRNKSVVILQIRIFLCLILIIIFFLLIGLLKNKSSYGKFNFRKNFFEDKEDFIFLLSFIFSDIFNMSNL